VADDRVIEVYLAQDISDFFDCIPIEQEIIKKNKEPIQTKKMLAFIDSLIGNPGFAFLVARDDERLVGYAILFINPFMDALQLLRVWYEPGNKEARDKLEVAGREWVSQFKIEDVMITATRGIKALKRRWGFRATSVNMKRRI